MSWSCEVPPSPVSPDPVGLSLRLAWPCWCSQVFWWLPALRGSSLCWAQSTWENGTAHSAPGLCLGQRCLNQEEFSIQIKCPGLGSLVALCPSAQGEKLPLQCLCSRVSEGLRAAPSSLKGSVGGWQLGWHFCHPTPTEHFLGQEEHKEMQHLFQKNCRSHKLAAFLCFLSPEWATHSGASFCPQSGLPACEWNCWFTPIQEYEFLCHKVPISTN